MQGVSNNKMMTSQMCKIHRVWYALAASALVLAACATQPSAPSATTAPAAPQEEAAAPAETTEATAAPAEGQPKYGGVWRFAGGMDVATLDPVRCNNFEDWWSCGKLLYNQLYAVNRDGRLQPELAADWPKISEDGKVYTISLRKGVKFHNGREMTAEDVKFSLERAAEQGWNKEAVKSIVGFEDIQAGKTKELSGIRIIDPHTIEITLNRPYNTFLYELGISSMSIVPKQEVIDAGPDWGSKVVIGTGPFMFKEWKIGEKLVYVRNPNYFKQGLPYIDQIELYVNVPAATALLRWESQEIDYTYAYAASAADLARILADPNLKERLVIRPSTNFAYIIINTKIKPFDDPRVRRALVMALDKKAYAQQGGAFRMPAESFYSPIVPQYNPDFKGIPYDPEGAKKLLAEAGYPDGIPGQYSMYAEGIGKEVGELIQADLKKIGIEISEVLVGDYGVHADRWEKGEMLLGGFGGAMLFPDAASIMYYFLCPEVTEAEKSEDGVKCDRRINELYEESKRMDLNDPERNKLFDEIMDIVVNKQIFINPLWTRQTVGLSQTYVKNLVTSPVYYLPELEEAWIDK